MGKKRRFSESESTSAGGAAEEEDLAEFTKNDNFKWRLNYVKDLGSYSKDQVEEAIDQQLDQQLDEKTCNRQVMLLPDGGGMNTPEGIPFHHTVSTDLKPHHLARLAKHGIRLRSGPMTKSEVEKIMDNWKEFSEEHNIKDEEAFNYIGICGFARRQDERNVERKWLRDVKFLPRMCSGLLDRSAASVGRYLRTRFHPSVVSQADLYRSWTPEEEKQLKDALDEDPNCNMEELSVKMRRTRFYLHARRNRMQERLETPVELTLHEKYKLYLRIKDIMHPQDPLQLIVKRDSNWQKALSKKQITELAAFFERTDAVIEQEWKDIGFNLIKAYNHYRENDEKTMKDVVKRAFKIKTEFDDEVFRKCLDYIFKLPGYHTLAQINHARLTKWIDDNKLTFPTPSERTMGQHVLFVTQKALKQLTQSGYMDRLPLNITVRDLIELLCELIDQKLFEGNLNGHNKPVKKAIKKFAKKIEERNSEKSEGV